MKHRLQFAGKKLLRMALLLLGVSLAAFLLLCASPLSADACFVLSLALTSFGGWCSVAQTRSMVQGTRLPITPYIIEKLITTLVTSLLAYTYIRLF